MTIFADPKAKMSEDAAKNQIKSHIKNLCCNYFIVPHLLKPLLQHKQTLNFMLWHAFWKNRDPWLSYPSNLLIVFSATSASNTIYWFTLTQFILDLRTFVTNLDVSRYLLLLFFFFLWGGLWGPTLLGGGTRAFCRIGLRGVLVTRKLSQGFKELHPWFLLLPIS